jgi:hypothetical protein
VQLHARQLTLGRVASARSFSFLVRADQQARKPPEHRRVHQHAPQPLGVQLILNPSSQSGIIHRRPPADLRRVRRRVVVHRKWH